MQLQTALEDLRDDGFALWIGAGVSRWISQDEGQQGTPFWPELAELLEGRAGLRRFALGESQLSLPQRLERVHRALGFQAFQAILRESILGRLANSIQVASWTRGSQGSLPIPERARHLANLGHLANPIVNFNIETLTSVALAGPSSPVSIKVFNHPKPTELDAFWRPRLNSPDRVSETFPRHVYHPHGAIEVSGVCVITETEYRSQEATLAFELATHSAFMSNLAIVGMSLEDHYLRKQLSKFRQQVRRILWFTNPSEVSEQVAAWASWIGVQIVETGSWPTFWESVKEHLPGPSDLALLEAWESVCQRAHDSLEGQTRCRKWFMDSLVPIDKQPQEIPRQHAERAAECGENLREPLTKLLATQQWEELRAAFRDSRIKLGKRNYGLSARQTV